MGLKAAGIPTRFPHQSHLYKAVLLCLHAGSKFMSPMSTGVCIEGVDQPDVCWPSFSGFTQKMLMC